MEFLGAIFSACQRAEHFRTTVERALTMFVVLFADRRGGQPLVSHPSTVDLI